MKFSHEKKVNKLQDKRKIAAIIAGIALVVVLSAFVFVRQWYNYNLRPVSTEYSEQITVIESGSTTSEIAEQLESEGLVRNARVFDWYVNNLDTDKFLQAGTYKLSPSYSTQEIAEIILDGRVDTSLITIAPGRRLDQVAKSLVDQGFTPEEVQQALFGSYSHPIFQDKPADTTLEGYVFPESYQITNSSTARSVVEHSLDTFYSLLTNDIMSGISSEGLNLYEAITLASIVQMETSDPETQKMVAGVFLNRLEVGLPLGADPTFRYASAIEGVEDQIDIDSPYNTRIYTGLPPGPIANFNISALEAVAMPTDSEYLYFVSGDDGNTYFAITFEEHQANVAKYCIDLCKL